MDSNNIKRILFISPQPFFEWRGSPIRISFNLHALTELGFSVDLLTLPFGSDINIAGANIIRVKNIFGLNSIPIGPSFGKLLFDFVLLFKAFSLCLKNKYSVIHSVEDAGIIGLFISKVFGCRHIFEKHSDPMSYKKGILKNIVLTVYKMVEYIVIKFSDAVIGTGPQLVSYSNKITDSSKTFHIFDIPSSLNEASGEKTEAIRKSLLKNKDELLILYVGSFAVYQGIELLFESIPKVLEENKNARFVIIGGSCEEIQFWKNKLKEKNADSRTEFIGKIPPDELPDYLSACDILLSPRISGTNTPLKILDYLKASKAIVATNVQANLQLLDSNTAVIAEPTPLEFSQAVCRLLADSELRLKLASNAKKICSDKYNFNEFKRLLAECYQLM